MKKNSDEQQIAHEAFIRGTIAQQLSTTDLTTIAKLKLDLEVEKMKNEQEVSKRKILEAKIENLIETNVGEAVIENNSLTRQVAVLKKQVAEAEENTQLKLIQITTKNTQLESQITILKSENNYKKELIESYQSLPNIKKMLESMSSIVVPNLDKYMEVVNAYKASNVEQLGDAMRELATTLKYNLRR